ncbi:MAG TPA: hypothetical protein VGG08_03645 [Solirubrobacteraceae bacterium]
MRARLTPRPLARVAGCFALALGLAACGSAHASRDEGPLTSAQCQGAVASTLGEVARRVYHAAGHGVVVGEAIHRVRSSPALAQAIRADDAGAAAAALRSLLAGQIVRVEVQHGGRTFATAGSGSALAPVSGSIPHTDARYVLSTQSEQSYLQVTHQVTGGELVLVSGGRRVAGTIPATPPAAELHGESPTPLTLAGTAYEAIALPGAAYPATPLQIVLLVPASSATCQQGSSLAEARVEALGTVGERIYKEEHESAYTKSILRRVERSPALREAAERRSVPAARAAIVGFFAAHIHVVRVRVTVPTATAATTTRGGSGSGSGGKERLLYDLGGPHVLAPVAGELHDSHGHLVGRFEMAIQDDAGYMKLARLFTGAEVLMRTSGGQVEGSLKPGPASVPTRGEVQYAGHSYDAYTFTAEAFPAGPLRISLLLGDD